MKDIILIRNTHFKKGSLICKLQELVNANQVTISRLKKDCESKDALIRKFRKQKTLLQNNNDSLHSGKLPKTVQHRAVSDVLIGNGRFTNAQVGQLLKPVKKIGKDGKKPITRCKNWSYEDYAKAMPLRCAGKKSYTIVRNLHNVPYPGLSTLDREFTCVAFTF